MANSWASATLKHPDGTQVHLIGVSHISAYSGHHVYHAIRNIRPDAVVLEVDERRYREAAIRAQRWLGDDDKRALVAHATQNYLQPGGIWRQLLWEDKRSAYNLSNEGGALVEGSIYGSEVILACEAASQCDAEIVLADRSKPVSNARLAKALLEEHQQRLQGQADDDASLLMRAAAQTVQQFKEHVSRAVRSLTATSSEFFGERLHPIFLLVAKPHYKLALKGAGCTDPDAVVAALERLIEHGSTPTGEISTADLKLVQDSIARIERQKARMRQRAFASTAAPGAHPPAADATSGDASAADACSSVSSATAPTPDAQVPVRGDHTADASSSGASDWSGRSFLRAIRSFFMEDDAAPASDRTDAFYQWCWRGVGNMHSFKLHEHVADFDATHLYTGPADMSPYYRTVVHERDTILATRLWHEAADPAKKKIVAVVGANHLPGIVQNWAKAGSDAMRNDCAEFLSAPGQAAAVDAPHVHSWQDAVVHGAAAAMQGVAVGALAYAPTKLLVNRARGVRASGWPLQLAAVPAVVLGGLTVGASLCDSWRMYRLAQLVDNLAAVPNVAD